MNLIFDLDGTLIDVSKRHYQVYHRIVSKFGGIPLSKSVYWRMKRNKTPLLELINRSSLSKDLAKKYINEFIKDIEDPNLLMLDKTFSYTIPTLDRLSKNANLYLVTFRQFTDRTIKQLIDLNLKSKFKDIKIGRLASTGIESKVLMIKQMLSKQKGIVIGDTEDDILCAQKLSFTSIAVTSGLRNKSKLNKHNPTYLINDIGNLPKIVKNKLSNQAI